MVKAVSKQVVPKVTEANSNKMQYHDFPSLINVKNEWETEKASDPITGHICNIVRLYDFTFKMNQDFENHNTIMAP